MLVHPEGPRLRDRISHGEVSQHMGPITCSTLPCVPTTVAQPHSLSVVMLCRPTLPPAQQVEFYSLPKTMASHTLSLAALFCAQYCLDSRLHTVGGWREGKGGGGREGRGGKGGGGREWRGRKGREGEEGNGGEGMEGEEGKGGGGREGRGRKGMEGREGRGRTGMEEREGREGKERDRGGKMARRHCIYPRFHYSFFFGGGGGGGIG